MSRKGGTGGGGWSHPQGDLLLGLAVKVPWLGPGGPILVLAVWTGLENAVEGSFLADKAAWVLS